MTDNFTKTLPKRIPTKESGIYYKEVQQTIIDDKGRLKTKIIDKVYIIRYRDGNKQHLVTVGKYSEGIREAYCKTKRNEFLTLAKNGELPPQVVKRLKKKTTTLNDLADIYFDDKAIANKTNRKQEQKYDLHIREALGAKAIEDLSKDDIVKLTKRLTKDKKAPQTINGVTTLLKAIINYSIKEKELQIINPCTGMKKLKVDDTRERFLSIDEVHTLIDTVKDDEITYLFAQLALSTGARLESILHIQKKDIDFVHNTITLKDLKSDNTYTGFMDDKLKQELVKVVAEQKPNSYCVGGLLEPLTSRVIQRRLKPVLDDLFNVDLELKDSKNRVVIHTLRHTFASQLAIKGVPIFTIQKLMNHADITMTMRYAKLAPEKKFLRFR